jgi:hypothetical protein
VQWLTVHVQVLQCCIRIRSVQLTVCATAAAAAAGLWNASCENGRQQFRGYGWPGLLTSHPTGTADYSIRGKFVVRVTCPRLGDWNGASTLA